MGRPRTPLSVRFWQKVEKTDGCWLWRGARTKGRYGFIQAGGAEHHMLEAHRVSWELHFGPIGNGLCVLHRCDVMLCVRPDHLFIGTKGDNNRDAVAKGRHRSVFRERPEVTPRGEAHWSSKLTEEAVRAIRNEYAAGVGSFELARRFGITPTSVWQIATRRTWRHV